MVEEQTLQQIGRFSWLPKGQAVAHGDHPVNAIIESACGRQIEQTGKPDAPHQLTC
jgi:hypothetical protein